MKTLVYLGCHEGYSLKRLLNGYSFDKIILVEADPDTFKKLEIFTKNKSNIIALNKCVVSEPNTKFIKFYRTINDGASNSVFKPEVGKEFIKDEIHVETVYLPDLFSDLKIENIDFYISDLQGNDFNVLKTVSSFIEEKKIKELFLETFNSNYSFYEKNDNKFENYYNLLKDNYKVDYFSADSTLLTTYSSVVDFLMNSSHGELDTHWSLKDIEKFQYMLT